jgi:hypothetical protein
MDFRLRSGLTGSKGRPILLHHQILILTNIWNRLFGAYRFKAEDNHSGPRPSVSFLVVEEEILTESHRGSFFNV